MKKILSIILTILFAFIYYYLFLPALNIHNITLYLFIIFIIIRRYKFRKVGTMSALYLIGYGIIRFFIEISRTDALLILGFKIAQIVSIIMIIIGIIILAKNKKKGRFEDLYNDSNNVDNLKF